MDTVEVLRRLLDRQRYLRQCDRLTGIALEELLLWLRVPLSARPFNARTMEQQIWDTISEQARHGSSRSVAALSVPREDPAVLLQPGMPTSMAEVTRAFDPAERPHTIAGLRRRAWRQHMETLHAQTGQALPEGCWPAEDDRRLLLLQTDEATEVTNFPASSILPHIVHVQPPRPLVHRRRVHGMVEDGTLRRRGFVPRRVRRLRPDIVPRDPMEVAASGPSSGSGALVEQGAGQQSEPALLHGPPPDPLQVPPRDDVHDELSGDGGHTSTRGRERSRSRDDL